MRRDKAGKSPTMLHLPPKTPSYSASSMFAGHLSATPPPSLLPSGAGIKANSVHRLHLNHSHRRLLKGLGQVTVSQVTYERSRGCTSH